MPLVKPLTHPDALRTRSSLCPNLNPSQYPGPGDRRASNAVGHREPRPREEGADAKPGNCQNGHTLELTAAERDIADAAGSFVSGLWGE